jgi:hypothetical protein
VEENVCPVPCQGCYVRQALVDLIYCKRCDCEVLKRKLQATFDGHAFEIETEVQCLFLAFLYKFEKQVGETGLAFYSKDQYT